MAKRPLLELAAKNVNKAARNHERARAPYRNTILKRGRGNKLGGSTRNTETEPAAVIGVEMRGRIHHASWSRSSRGRKNGLDHEI
jgi:hypothetical protein